MHFWSRWDHVATDQNFHSRYMWYLQGFEPKWMNLNPFFWSILGFHSKTCPTLILYGYLQCFFNVLISDVWKRSRGFRSAGMFITTVKTRWVQETYPWAVYLPSPSLPAERFCMKTKPNDCCLHRLMCSRQSLQTCRCKSTWHGPVQFHRHALHSHAICKKNRQVYGRCAAICDSRSCAQHERMRRASERSFSISIRCYVKMCQICQMWVMSQMYTIVTHVTSWLIGYIRHCKAGSLDHAGAAGATSQRKGCREKAVNAAYFLTDIKK